MASAQHHKYRRLAQPLFVNVVFVQLVRVQPVAWACSMICAVKSQRRALTSHGGGGAKMSEGMPSKAKRALSRA